MTMPSLPQDVHVTAMCPLMLARLKREHGLHRAAQTLADAVRCQRGERPMPLSQMALHEREWFKQTARQLVEMFETVVADGGGQ